MASVRLHEVSKRYAPDLPPTIDRVSLEVAHGEFFILLGPSGCGKSTLLRSVAGLEEISAGEVLIGDRRVDGLPPRERDIAMVFQSYALYPHMSVRENLAFGLRMRNTPRAEIERRVCEVAPILGLEELLDRRPRQLSGGQRQRVALGRAIVREPAVFLLDEPLSNLDAKLRGSMRVELKRLHQRLGATMIYVTHDQVEAMTLGDRIAILQGGRLQQVGAPLEVYARPANVFVAKFIGSPPMNVLPARREGELGLRLGEGRWELPPALAAARPPGAPVQVGVRPEDLRLGAAGSGLPARVAVVEPLGAETLVTLDSEAGPLVARTGPEARPRPGDPVGLAAPPEALHLFDADDGVRLAPTPAPMLVGESPA
ncbi:MAG: sn-glycerol-3-phosphate ABC transporter ATP-binding protein UgpC [Planctomycetota bacterium]|nr:MAG: sn-glycerol-3-phosphate ABC transporter ATP-binding protein UgpC [Planctomycetota bacterium]